MTRDQRRLTAIVSADVVGYSRLMGRDEGGTLAALKAHLRELIDPKIAEHGGRTVKSMGDGLLLEFPSVVDAVRCAVEVQRGMAERNVDVPDDRQIRFRVGINVGDIIIDGDDIFGDGVNVAARLQTLAEPGGICVSRGVRDQVLDKLSFTFEDLGAQQVKNIARPIEAYRIRDEPTGGAVIKPRPVLTVGTRPEGQRQAAGWRWWAGGALALGLAGLAAWSLPHLFRPASAPGPPPLSLAILPFAPPGGAPADALFAESLTQDVTTSITGWRWATVAAYGSAAGYKDKPFDARSIGQELNVRYLLTGEARTVGESTQVTARLIDAKTGTQVWTVRLEFAAQRPPETPPVPHLLLAKRLRSGLLAAETRRVMSQPVGDSPMESTLRGVATEDDSGNALKAIRAAREIYGSVLQRDPNFVPAMWRFVETLQREWIENPAPDRDQLAKEMDNWSSRAIRVDPLDFEAWRARVWALQIQGRWDEALAASARAQALFPASVGSVLDQAFALNYSGRPGQALPVAEQARAMDPQDAGPYHFLCKILLYLGRYSDALAACERAAALENGWFNQFYLAVAYANTGDLAKATIAKDAMLQQQPGFSIQRYREMFRSSPPAFFELVDRHIAPALRKIGLAEY